MDDTRADDLLHKTLSNIFRERSLSRAEIAEFLRAPEHGNDRNSVVELIFEHLTEKVELAGNFSLLWIAVLYSYQKSAELLVRCGADVNEVCSGSEQFLVSFVREVLRIKLVKDSTLLHVIIKMKSSPENERLVRLVVDHGANLESLDSRGRSVLHYAVSKGRVKVAEILMKRGADVNVADIYGMTPLLFAASSSKPNDLLPLLIKHGADATVKDDSGKNVLHHLAQNHMAEVAVDVARVLIEKGASLEDCEDEYQDQPLHLAVYYEKIDLVSNRIFVICLKTLYLFYSNRIFTGITRTCVQPT